MCWLGYPPVEGVYLTWGFVGVVVGVLCQGSLLFWVLGSLYSLFFLLVSWFFVLCFYNGLFLVLIFGRFWAWWDWVGILEWLVPWAAYLSVEVFVWLVWIVGGL